MIDADMTEMDVVEIALTTAERLGQHALTWKRRLVEAEATIQRVREQIAQSLDERQAYVMIDKLFEALDGDA